LLEAKIEFAGDGTFSDCVDILNTTSGNWFTAKLSVPRGSFAATSIGELAIFGGGGIANCVIFNTVDILNTATGQWNTTMLSQTRGSLAATSIDGLAFFGGGYAHVGDNYGPSAIVDIFAYCNNSTATNYALVCNPSPNPSPEPKPGKPSNTLIIILLVCATSLAVAIALGIIYAVYRYKRRYSGYIEIGNLPTVRRIEDVLPLERLGEGNFGEVYRGVMEVS
jgi:hypothetical protein